MLFGHGADELLPLRVLVEGDDVVGHLVHHVDGAAVYVDDDVVAVELIGVDHSVSPIT